MNKKMLTALILNIFVVVSTAAVTISYYFYSSNPLAPTGLDSYKFFTTDSNILAALSSLVMIPFEVRVLRGKRDKLPRAATVFKYVGMTSLMLTFFTVFILLFPVYGPQYLVMGTSFFMHVSGPLAAMVTFLFLETDRKVKVSDSFLALLPCIVYGSVYLFEVIIIGEKNGGWMDFYTFNRGGYWYITMFVMLVCTYLIAVAARLIHNKFCDK